MKSCMKRMSVLKLWRSVARCRFASPEGMETNVQCHLSICQVCFARCAKVPCKLSEAHCKLCKGALQIVRSTLQAVQRRLANCQKHIASFAKAPCKLSEAHCTLCKGALQIVKSPLQIAKVVLIMQWIKKLKVFTTKIITYYYDELPSFKRPGAGIGDIRRSQ